MRIEWHHDFGVGGWWDVVVDKDELVVQSGKKLPYPAYIGTISVKDNRIKVRVGTPAAYKPHGYPEAAKAMMVKAVAELLGPHVAKSEREAAALGELRTIEAKKSARAARNLEADMNKKGSFIVRTSDGKERRFFSMRTEVGGRGTYEGAMEWAEKHLKTLRPGARAEFFRAHVEGATPRTGSPWTEPFHAMEVDPQGRVGWAASLKKSGGGGGSNMTPALPYFATNTWGRPGGGGSTAEPLTVTLRGGDEVLAKLYKGQPSAYTYANRTQAEKAQEKVGPGWEVIQRGRPWFVRRVKGGGGSNMTPALPFYATNTWGRPGGGGGGAKTDLATTLRSFLHSDREHVGHDVNAWYEAATTPHGRGHHHVGCRTCGLEWTKRGIYFVPTPALWAAKRRKS